MKKLFQLLTVFAALLCLSLSSSVAFACTPGTNASANEVLTGVSQGGQDCSATGVSDTLSTAVSILSYVAGAVALIMIIVAGIKYMTSGGDSNRVGSAKTTLIYALIGIAVAGVAQLLVHFVLSQANKVSGG